MENDGPQYFDSPFHVTYEKELAEFICDTIYLNDSDYDAFVAKLNDKDWKPSEEVLNIVEKIRAERKGD